MSTGQGRWCSVAGKVTRPEESTGNLPQGGWLTVTCRLTACTPGSAPNPMLGNEYGKPLPFYHKPAKSVKLFWYTARVQATRVCFNSHFTGKPGRARFPSAFFLHLVQNGTIADELHMAQYNIRSSAFAISWLSWSCHTSCAYCAFRTV